MELNMLLIQVVVVSLLYIGMHFLTRLDFFTLKATQDAEPQVKLILGDSGIFLSGGSLNLTSTVDRNVSISSVIFKRDQVLQIGIYDPTVFNCTPSKLLTDNYSYTASCDGDRNFTLTKHGVQTEDHGKVWQCTMVSSAGGPCTSITPCASQNVTAFQRAATTGPVNTAITTEWIVGSVVGVFVILHVVILGFIFRRNICKRNTSGYLYTTSFELK